MNKHKMGDSQKPFLMIKAAIEVEAPKTIHNARLQKNWSSWQRTLPTPRSGVQNRKADMLIKAMEDFVFRENTKQPNNRPAIQHARSAPRKRRHGDHEDTQNKSSQAKSQKNQKSGDSQTPTNTRSSKSTRSIYSHASTKAVGDQMRRSTENQNTPRIKQRRRIHQKNAGAKSAKCSCTALALTSPQKTQDSLYWTVIRRLPSLSICKLV